MITFLVLLVLMMQLRHVTIQLLRMYHANICFLLALLKRHHQCYLFTNHLTIYLLLKNNAERTTLKEQQKYMEY